MSEVALFAFGSVLFMATTWATFSFGLKRISELSSKEMEDANLVAVSSDNGLTSIHVDRERALGDDS